MSQSSPVKEARLIVEEHMIALYGGGMDALAAYLEAKTLTAVQAQNLVLLIKLGYIMDPSDHTITKYGLKYAKIALQLLAKNFPPSTEKIDAFGLDIEVGTLLKQANTLKKALLKKSYV